MEEQYITFETAQLSKEKGFNVHVNNAYDLKGEFGNYYDIVNEYYYYNFIIRLIRNYVLYSRL